MTEKKVYILLTDTGTLFTKTIKLYTRKPYNHASIAFDENLTQTYSFGRKKPRNPFIGGFIRENTKEGLFENATCAVYSLTVRATDFDKMQQCIKKLDAEKDNYRYNLIGLIAVIFNKQLKRENAFFCSQFVASVLKQSDSIDFNKPTSLVTPHDLQTTANIELVYQGKLKDYNKRTTNKQYTNMICSPAGIVSV